ncbi:MAG: hypothetical protein RIF41_26685 [Polyangiaceae bacterium]
MPSTIRLVLAVSATLLGSACIHDWDSLEAPDGVGGDTAEGGGGSSTGTETGTGTGATCPTTDTSVEGLCEVYCDQVNDCVTSDPSCMSNCESDMAACPPGMREQIRECMDAIDTCTCSGLCNIVNSFDSGFRVCMTAMVTCWTPPHSCP